MATACARKSFRRHSAYSPVIDHPKFWKSELHRKVWRLQRAFERDGVEVVAQSSVTIERFVFVTAYIVRKLKEADVLTRDVTASKWAVTKFPCIAPPPHREWFKVSHDEGKTWRQPLESHYDFMSGNPEYLCFSKLSNYLIHHFAFALRYYGRTDEIGAFFNSDHTKDRLYRVALHDYVALVEEVAYDEPRWVDMDSSRRKDPVIRRRQRPASE